MDDGGGRYELLDLLGAGGMAEVYRARMVGAAGFEKVVAIKRILADFSSDEEFLRRFVDEARLTASTGSAWPTSTRANRPSSATGRRPARAGNRRTRDDPAMGTEGTTPGPRRP